MTKVLRSALGLKLWWCLVHFISFCFHKIIDMWEPGLYVQLTPGKRLDIFSFYIAITTSSCIKHSSRNGILLPKLFWPTVRKNCLVIVKKKLKLEAEGWEFAKILRSPKQFFQTVKQQFLVTKCFLNLFLEFSYI